MTAAAWSPNGGLLATTASDLKLCLWDTKTQKTIASHDVRATIVAMAWHPTNNTLAYTNSDGELYIHTSVVPTEHLPLLQAPRQPAPLLYDALAETSGNAPRRANGAPKDGVPARRRRDSLDSLDDILGSDVLSGDGGDQDMDDFIEDDDGAGYVNGHGKRTNAHLDAADAAAKRRAYGGGSAYGFAPRVHEPVQTGSTPWRGNRRYLCLNLTGFVWTVRQETHHTVTVEFFDRELHRDFHFTDPFLYDQASLADHGALFASPPAPDAPATVYYRPHETWTARADWRTRLPAGEAAVAIALSASYVVVTTSAGYVRVFTLFGVPLRVHRAKAAPGVACVAFRDYVLTVGNGPVAADGACALRYSLENVRRDETHQADDVVALPPGARLAAVFFSDAGDPYIFDSTGVLLALLHWREPAHARWVPVLDTRRLPHRATYWPVAVAANKFHCIVLKGADKYPYFPRPILSEFDFHIPLTSPPGDGKPKQRGADDVDDDADADADADASADSEQTRLEGAFVLASTLHAQLASTVAHTRPSASQRQALVDLEVQVDRTLLQLLGIECLAGEDHGMKALEIVTLMRNANGKMLDLAGRVAAKYSRDVLADKIRELAERRMVGLDGGDDDDGA